MNENNIPKPKWVILIPIAVFIIFMAPVIFPNLGVSGKNIKITTTSDSDVYFKIVCPECHHIEGTYRVELSKGESHSTIHICNKCYEVFDVEIKR